MALLVASQQTGAEQNLNERKRMERQFGKLYQKLIRVGRQVIADILAIVGIIYVDISDKILSVRCGRANRPAAS